MKTLDRIGASAAPAAPAASASAARSSAAPAPAAPFRARPLSALTGTAGLNLSSRAFPALFQTFGAAAASRAFPALFRAFRAADIRASQRLASRAADRAGVKRQGFYIPPRIWPAKAGHLVRTGQGRAGAGQSQKKNQA